MVQSYPATAVTNLGISIFEDAEQAQITYTSPDGLIFYLNGGLAPWPGVIEGVALADGISGLHPQFKQLDHTTARLSGVDWAATVFDPAEVKMLVTATAQSPQNLRKIIRQWIAAWSPDRAGTLSWVTPDGGAWWAKVRLFRPPPEKLEAAYPVSKEQTFTWSIRVDDAFWRSHDSTSQFRFAHDDSRDQFKRTDTATLGTSWSQTYSGGTAGTCGTDGSRAIWTASGTAARTVVNRWLGVNSVQTVTVNGAPSSFALTYDNVTTSDIAFPASAATVQSALESLANIGSGNVSVAAAANDGPYTVTFTGNLGAQPVSTLSGAVVSGGTNPYVTCALTTPGMSATTGTDNQVVESQFGMFHSWPFPDGAYVDLWARLDSAGTTGLRLRIGVGSVTLSRFNAGVETQMHSQIMLLTPFPWEKFAFVCGTASNSRTYKLLRDGFPILVFTETDSGSALGSSNRGGGFGMTAGAGSTSQAVPPTVDTWSMGDNESITQSGELPLTNFGEREEWPDFVVYGPGTFYFGDGPGVAPTIEFGPLTENQVALVRSHPGKRAVYDLTAESSGQDLTFYQSLLEAVFSLAFNNNIPPLVDWFESFFGITPPQKYLYPLLKGRWSSPVPAPNITESPSTSRIAVQIKEGDATSKVVASITPRRRWPD